MNDLNFRPLGEVKQLMDKIGTDISYFHDDLVFVEHSAYIIQFDNECDYNLLIHFNADCEKNEAQKMFKTLQHNSQQFGLTVLKSTGFKMKQVEGKEEIQLEFV